MLSRSRRDRSARRVVAPSPRTRLRMEPLEDRLAPATFTVTNIADGGAGSLRLAINQANAIPGADLIAFNIGGAGVHTINLASPLPAITDRVTIAGHTQPGFAGAPLIELNGAGAGAGAHGLVIHAGASGSVVRGLVIDNFGGNGIRIRADDCRVRGNFIGTNADGTAAAGNVIGVNIGGTASGNVIGGTTAGTRNVISGNLGGVQITGASASGNLVMGNYIGTNAAGTAALGSFVGVIISAGAGGNVIGGSAVGARNVISGNGVGVTISDADGNVVLGNFIGPDWTGTVALGNTSTGVSVSAGAGGNVIGGTVARARNVISDNGGNGVHISGAGTTGNVVLGNRIGIDRTGTVALANTSDGVSINGGASGNVIGGASAGARNVISGNGSDGVHLSGAGTTGNRVLGNFIGTDRTGEVARGNTDNGVHIAGAASGNVIGGAVAAAGNVISDNGDNGVYIHDAGSDGNRVRGNRIGLAVAGSAVELGNNLDGVFIESDADGNVVGGTAAGAGNVIAHNGEAGVDIHSGTGNAVLGNSIFDNVWLGIDLGGFLLTPNDLDDPDAGANDLMNFPDLDLARVTATGLRVRGSINTQPNKTVRIEFFANTPGDPGEGRQFLGFVTVNTTALDTTADFNVLFPIFGVPVGSFVTATATDNLGNTSEFSVAELVI